MRYLLILSICVGAYILSQVVPSPEGDHPMYYVFNSSWALLVLLSVIIVDRTNIVYGIAILELGAIFLNFVTLYNGLSYKNFFYHNYNYILMNINVSEAILLLLGAPWRGVYTRIKSGMDSLFKLVAYDDKFSYRVMGNCSDNLIEDPKC